MSGSLYRLFLISHWNKAWAWTTLVRTQIAKPTQPLLGACLDSTWTKRDSSSGAELCVEHSRTDKSDRKTIAGKPLAEKAASVRGLAPTQNATLHVGP